MIEEIGTIYNLLESEKYVEAQAAIKEALLKYPDSPDVLVLQSEIPLRIGKLKIAEKILMDILNRFPDNPKALNNLACAKILWRRWDEAVTLLHAVLKAEPSNEDAVESLKFMLSENSVPVSVKTKIENELCNLK